MRTKRILFALLAALLGGATPSGGDASGCSFYDGTPNFIGCIGRSGSCYHCIYTGQFGYSECYESADGEVAFCIDFQS